MSKTATSPETGGSRVRGRRFRVPIVDSHLDWAHGLYRYVEEIYLPELKIAFNNEGYVFEADEKRYKPMELPDGREIYVEYLGEVEVPEEDVKLLLRFLDLKKRVKNLISRYF